MHTQCRVVAPNSEKTIGKHTFANWGAHYDGYPCTYLTAAAAIGMSREEVDIFCKRLDRTLTKFKHKRIPPSPSTGKDGDNKTDKPKDRAETE